jgi:transmembrane sensor
MKSENKIRLLQNFLNGNITDNELKDLFVWLNTEEGSLEYNKLFDEKWFSNKFETDKDIDSSILFSKIKARMEDKQLAARKKIFIRLRNTAAIFILGLLIPVVYYKVLNPVKESKGLIYFKESLSNEKIRKMTLPDGTNVWLMSGSSITYPGEFSGSKTRSVELTGEAFFDVRKDSLCPFIVKLGELGLRVTGTSFNVMNYGDEEHVQVVLCSGKVDLFKGEYHSDNRFVHLVPGQLGIYTKGKAEFRIRSVDVAKYTSWIDGTLLFRDDPLSEVLKKLGRWYNIEVEVKDPEVSRFPFTATIRNENLDQIVDLLEYTTPFNYSVGTTDGVTKLVIRKKL